MANQINNNPKKTEARVPKGIKKGKNRKSSPSSFLVPGGVPVPVSASGQPLVLGAPAVSEALGRSSLWSKARLVARHVAHVAGSGFRRLHAGYQVTSAWMRDIDLSNPYEARVG